VTSPVEQIRVECPRCGREYDDWTRGSVNLNLDDFDDDYLRECSTATCPSCGFVADLGLLVVDGHVWTLSKSHARR
jgi:ribosomal protein S27AE